MAANPVAQAYNRALVEALKRETDLRDPAIEAAFLAVPRHLFLPQYTLERAYADEALPIKRDSDGSVLSSASQPSMIALMLRQLRLQPGHNVLEIGAGTGYNAALIQHIVGDEGAVTSVELDPDLVEQAQTHLQHVGMGSVQIVQGDGALGYAPRASYDRIICTAAVWDVPPAWIRQLKRGGRLVTPIGGAGQFSAAFTLRPDGTLYSRENIPCRFIALRGIAAGPATYCRVGSSGVTMVSDDAERLDTASLHLLLSDDVEITRLSPSLTAREYWQGFLPYLMLHVPPGFIFAMYTVSAEQHAYGLEDSGFALIGPGSASFVPFQGRGEVHCYGAADALLALGEVAQAWDAAGRPGSGRLRLRLLHHEDDRPPPARGVIFPRLYHDLHMWQDERDGRDH